MERKVRKIAFIAAMIASCNVFASDVELFLSSIQNSDEISYQALSDYRSRIVSNCKRDVTVPELRKFQVSSQFAYMLSSRSMTQMSTPQYDTSHASVTCDQFKVPSAK
jgi:hypothetical protein